MSLDNSMRCWVFVTAGSSPTLATRRLSRAFIKVDLPTLGTPIIIMRSGLVASLRCGASWRQVGRICPTAPGFLVFIAMARVFFCAFSASSHCCVTLLSAKSALFRIFRQGRWRNRRISSTIGLLEAIGQRASTTSITKSVISMVSAALLRAEFMCPGNH